MDYLIRAAPGAMGLILVVLGVALFATGIGLFYSARTRRLAVFALLVISLVAVIVACVIYVWIKWFPAPYV